MSVLNHAYHPTFRAFEPNLFVFLVSIFRILIFVLFLGVFLSRLIEGGARKLAPQRKLSHQK